MGFAAAATDWSAAVCLKIIANQCFFLAPFKL